MMHDPSHHHYSCLYFCFSFVDPYLSYFDIDLDLLNYTLNMTDARRVNNLQTVVSDPLLSQFKHHFILRKLPIPQSISLPSFIHHSLPASFPPNFLSTSSVYIAQIRQSYDNNLFDVVIGLRRDDEAIKIGRDVSKISVDGRQVILELCAGFKGYIEQIQSRQRQLLKERERQREMELEKQRERQRQKERQKERQRQRERQRDIQIQKEKEKEEEKERQIERERQIEIQRQRQFEKQKQRTKVAEIQTQKGKDKEKENKSKDQNKDESAKLQNAQRNSSESDSRSSSSSSSSSSPSFSASNDSQERDQEKSISHDYSRSRQKDKYRHPHHRPRDFDRRSRDYDDRMSRDRSRENYRQRQQRDRDRDRARARDRDRARDRERDKHRQSYEFKLSQNRHQYTSQSSFKARRLFLYFLPKEYGRNYVQSQLSKQIKFTKQTLHFEWRRDQEIQVMVLVVKDKILYDFLSLGIKVNRHPILTIKQQQIPAHHLRQTLKQYQLKAYKHADHSSSDQQILSSQLLSHPAFQEKGIQIILITYIQNYYLVICSAKVHRLLNDVEIDGWSLQPVKVCWRDRLRIMERWYRMIEGK